MKHLLSPIVLLLVALLPEDKVALKFEPEAGTVLKREFTAEAEYKLADVTASVDGEALPAPEDLPAFTMGFTEHIAVTDALESVAGGRATEFVRTYDELSQSDKQTLGDEEASQELSSPLQGRKLRYTFDEDEQRHQVKPADDESLDDDLAATLAADMDLLLLLPDHEVEPGDEWQVDPKLYLAFMWPSGLLDFHADGQEVTAEERDSSRQTIEHLEGSGTARLEEVREEDGVRVAVIHVELDITTGSKRVQEASEEDGLPEARIEVEIEREIEGTILWDLEHGHARSADLECKASRLESVSRTLAVEKDGEEAEVEFEQAQRLEGSIRYRASIERE